MVIGQLCYSIGGLITGLLRQHNKFDETVRLLLFSHRSMMSLVTNDLFVFVALPCTSDAAISMSCPMDDFCEIVGFLPASEVLQIRLQSSLRTGLLYLQLFQLSKVKEDGAG